MTTKTFDPKAIMEAHKAQNLARGLGVRCPICDAGLGKFCAMPDQSKDREFRGSHAERLALVAK